MTRPPLLRLLALLLVLTGCDVQAPAEQLLITQVSFSQSVVLPGETITIAVTVEGATSPSFEWSADAGELSAPTEGTTDWTAPGTEQLVAITVVVTDGDRSAQHEADVVVGPGADHDGDGYSIRQGDCDDTNPAVHPGAPDAQDGLDNDCDGEIDEGAPDADDDGDGFTDLEGDCDDDNDAVHPDAIEVENGIDDDCDNRVDEGTPAADDDGDGFCEAELSCVGGASPGDCNDNSSAINPNAPETLDNIDNDCDGLVDEGTAAYDDDGDGFNELQGDCNDDPVDGPDIYPGQAEAADGVDNDCDGLIDEDFLADADNDGWSVLAGDCDDTNLYTYPGAAEFADGQDNDCNGLIDDAMDGTDDDGDGLSEADGDCDDTSAAISPNAPEIEDPLFEVDNDCDGFFFANPPFAIAAIGSLSTCRNGLDDDGDGWTDSADPDCGSGMDEVGTSFLGCNDGIDNDSDGDIDAADVDCGVGFQADEADATPDDCADGTDDDGDGWIDGEDPDCTVAPFNENGSTTAACSDGVDNDSDGDVDEADAECDSGFDGSESDAAPDDCADGVDGDGDGWIDGADPDCLVAPYDEAGLGTALCSDGIDNDGDGLADGLDAGCSSATDMDETADTCSVIALDAINSWDPDGDALDYYWYFAFQPIDSELASSDISNGSTPAASFTPDRAGTWTLGLIVSDGQFNSLPDFITMQISLGVCP